MMASCLHDPKCDLATIGVLKGSYLNEGTFMIIYTNFLAPDSSPGKGGAQFIPEADMSSGASVRKSSTRPPSTRPRLAGQASSGRQSAVGRSQIRKERSIV